MSYLTLRRCIRMLTPLAAVLCIAGSRPLPAQVITPSVNEDPYIQFLEQRSMLFQAEQEAGKISGEGVQWRSDYGQPEPTQLVKTASVWLLYYPGSVIPKPGASVIGTWADPQFWDAVHEVGIDLIHTNPVKRAGGIQGETYTPTIDGWFDRISLEIDPQLGTDEEFKQMVQLAGERGAIVAEDLVPLHTGLGADFRLAERAYKDYPGLYTMVEIDPQDWGLLPQVDDPWGTALVPKDAAVQLWQKGYIPGLINSADAASGANEWSGWSATPEVVGFDGQQRRWVYLHVFKPSQPTLNWLDPSYASRRALFGDSARTIIDLGARVMRLDAVPFLGVEPGPNSEMTATLYLHPLSVVGAEDLAFMARKLGGWTFQELNVPIEQMRDYTAHGPDLAYDFFTRAQVLHPLLTGDAQPLRIAHSLLLQFGVQAGTMIHDLQNHDEITYQLIDLGSRDDIQFEGQRVNGKQLKEQILNEMRAKEGTVPYNKLYRPEQDGIATTFAGFIAPAVGVADPYNATPDQVALIQRAHLLIAHANAMVPGVFAISAWDLVGALPIPEASVADRTQDGDFRWINRGGVDLLGTNPTADKSAFGIPKAQALYGSLTDQLKSPDSFASHLKQMLAARKQNRIPEAQMLAVPNVGNPAVCVLVMQLPESQTLAVTALNYGHDATSIDIDLTLIPPGIPAASVAGQAAHDIIANQSAGTVSDAGHLTLPLDGLSGKTVTVPRN
jgi:trehalose synthase